MDESMKKPIMIAVIVVCLVLAGVITWRTRRGGGGGLNSIPADAKVLVKCANSECGAEYEVGRREYYAFLKKNMNPLLNSNPPMTCTQCGKPSIYPAVKCEKCGNVFFKNAGKPGDFPDRCPKCEYSKMEDERKRAAGQ